MTKALLIAVLLSRAAPACTTCNSTSAKAVRAQVLGPDFWPNLFVLALPVMLMLVIVAVTWYDLWPQRVPHRANRKVAAP